VKALRGRAVGSAREVRAQTVTHAETGEIFAAIPLVDWQKLAADARELAPCGDDCHGAGCELAKSVLAIDEEVTRD